MNDTLKIIQGDALTELQLLPTESVHCCVTSPPYWGLRDYSTEGQLGLEKTPEQYVAKMVEIFREVRRVLRKDGTLWLNLGDSYARAGGYSNNNGLDGVSREECQRARSNAPEGVASQKLAAGLKEKDLCGIPWRVAFALQADGWYLRSDIIWAKPNPMPESVTDRPTKAHEYLFLFAKSQCYFFDAEAIKERSEYPDDDRKARALNGQKCYPDEMVAGIREGSARYASRNKRSVWTVATAPCPEAHFATYPPDLIKPCILAGTRAGDTVLDCFAGSGTTGAVALELGRYAILIELNPKYIQLIKERCDITPGLQLV